MKTTAIVRVAMSLAVAAGLGGAYYLGQQQGHQQASGSATVNGAHEGHDPGTGAEPETGKRILYWRDPMVPGQRFDKPGKSPYMDMPLIPVYEEDNADGSAVRIDSRVTQNLGIRTAEVKLGRLEMALQVPGNVAINERSIEVIQARTTGFVEHTYVRTTMETVRKGQALAQIYSPDWVAAQEEYLAVARMPGNPQPELRDAALARMRQVGMTDDQIRSVQASGKLQPRLTVNSAVDGIVTEVGARDGMTVPPGMTLFRIASLATMWVLAEVPESQAAALRPGQAVMASTTALPNRALPGKVDTILPDVSTGTRTIKVRIELQNKDRKLLPGMFVSVRMVPAGATERLIVPSEALIWTGTRTIAMVAKGEGGFDPVEIKAGATAGGQTEILEGLKAGQQVVVSGQFLIDSEASLRGTVARMQETSATPVDNAASEASAAGPEHRAVGRIQSIGERSLTIAHDAIPSAQWGAMTMEFAAPPAGLPQGLKAGDRVAFSFRLDPHGMATLVTVAPQAQTAGAKP